MKLMSIRRFAFAILLVGFVRIAVAQSSGAASDVDKRVDSILRQMTLEEKITYIGGIDPFFIRSVPRFGIPELKMSDGPLGVHDYGPTTAYAAASRWRLRGTLTLHDASVR